MYTLTTVSKIYSGVQALLDVTISIPVDRIVVMMGPSGSGKSTLLRLLSFIEQPTTGSVRLSLNGIVYSSDQVERPWPKVTCVFQKLFLWPHMTLRENIRLPLLALGRQDCDNALGAVIDLFNMDEFIDRYPNEVSGGQAQRVALARALALNPKVVLIDEAHTGLDLEQQFILNEHFRVLRSKGVGLIIVSHSPEFAYRYADYLVVVAGGKVIEAGERNGAGEISKSYLMRAMNFREGAPEKERESHPASDCCD